MGTLRAISAILAASTGLDAKQRTTLHRFAAPMFQMNRARSRNQSKERLLIEGVQFRKIHGELLSSIQHQESSIEWRCSIGNQQSEFRNSIDPFAPFGCEN